MLSVYYYLCARRALRVLPAVTPGERVGAKELDAAKAYQKLQKDIAKLSASKAKVKQAEFAEKWKGTRAGERAMAASRKKD